MSNASDYYERPKRRAETEQAQLVNRWHELVDDDDLDLERLGSWAAELDRVIARLVELEARRAARARARRRAVQLVASAALMVAGFLVGWALVDVLAAVAS